MNISDQTEIIQVLIDIRDTLYYGYLIIQNRQLVLSKTIEHFRVKQA